VPAIFFAIFVSKVSILSVKDRCGPSATARPSTARFAGHYCAGAPAQWTTTAALALDDFRQRLIIARHPAGTQ
jgi:hypothetical protein